jgi:hypothetical protein
MKAIETLHNLGQSLWLHDATRDLLKSGVLKSYIKKLSLTGLTSDPTNFIYAIRNDGTYDEAIVKKLKRGKTGRGIVLRAGPGKPHPSRGSVQTHLRPNERRGWLGVVEAVAFARPKHSWHPGRGERFVRPGETSQHLNSNPRNVRRLAGR